MPDHFFFGRPYVRAGSARHRTAERAVRLVAVDGNVLVRPRLRCPRHLLCQFCTDVQPAIIGYSTRDRRCGGQRHPAIVVLT